MLYGIGSETEREKAIIASWGKLPSGIDYATAKPCVVGWRIIGAHAARPNPPCEKFLCQFTPTSPDEGAMPLFPQPVVYRLRMPLLAC